MKSSNILILAVAIIIVNAGITLVLINQCGGRDVAAGTMFRTAPKQPAEAIDRVNAITQAVALVEPAVVSVNVTEIRYVRGLRQIPFGVGFFDFLDFSQRRQEIKSIGSGVIYDPS